MSRLPTFDWDAQDSIGIPFSNVTWTCCFVIHLQVQLPSLVSMHFSPLLALYTAYWISACVFPALLVQSLFAVEVVPIAQLEYHSLNNVAPLTTDLIQVHDL